jgi:uncharacterized protein
MCTVKANVLSKILVTLGALNWGLVGMFKFDLVSALFGKNSAGTRLIYTLVGMAAIYLLIIARSQHRSAMREHGEGGPHEAGSQKGVPQ